jgi:proline utilization trans-activator
MATYGYMDGEHLFSAAIILVMVNIAFPPNPRDRAAMELALDTMNGIAEKGNTHIKSLHRLLLNLTPRSGDDSRQDTGPDPTELAVVHNSHQEPPPAPFPAFLTQNDLVAGGYLDLNQSVFHPDDGGLMAGMASDADARIWEEGYGIFDVNMEFDWTQWSS